MSIKYSDIIIIILMVVLFMPLDCSAVDAMDFSGFVEIADEVEGVILEIRYYSEYNFMGVRVYGYLEPVALLGREAASALNEAAKEFSELGYAIKIFDAYRPQAAVDHFVRWAGDTGDTRMKEFFYPDVDKKDLIAKGYIAKRSGHSRGSAVDITLVDKKSGKEIDMGSPFDLFGEISHYSCKKSLSHEAIANRKLLRDVMKKHGFKPLSVEWWHFTLKNEPWPNTYFTFPVKSLAGEDYETVPSDPMNSLPRRDG